MEYNALITIDLPGSDEDTRKTFYQILEDEKWKKLKHLTTAWEVQFNDGVTKQAAIAILKEDLEKAKSKSGAKEAFYAIQIAETDLVLENRPHRSDKKVYRFNPNHFSRHTFVSFRNSFNN